jgi:hypothetical protein
LRAWIAEKNFVETIFVGAQNLAAESPSPKYATSKIRQSAAISPQRNQTRCVIRATLARHARG